MLLVTLRWVGLSCLLFSLFGCLGENDGAPDEVATMFALGGQDEVLMKEGNKVHSWAEPTEIVMKAKDIFGERGIAITDVRCAIGQPPMPYAPPGVAVVQISPNPVFVLLFKTAKSNVKSLRGWQIDSQSNQRFLVDEFGDYDWSLGYPQPFDPKSLSNMMKAAPFVALDEIDCQELLKSSVFPKT